MVSSTYRKLVVHTPSRNFRAATQIVTVPIPQLNPNEVLVKNHYAGVNASDVNIAAGVYFVNTPLPWDLGVEIAGEVVAVGDQVTHLKVGDPVIAIGMGKGYAEYAVFAADALVPVPSASPELMTLWTAGLAASIGLEVAGNMQAGETVLITAAAGGTGHLAVQIAKQAGCHVIGTCSTDAKADYLASLGCDRPINLRREDLGNVLVNEYPSGIPLIFESVGGEVFDTCVEHLGRRGRLITIGHIAEYATGPQPVTQPRIYTQLLWKSATVQGFLYSDYPEHIPAHFGKLLEQTLAERLQVQVDPTQFRGVESIVDAVEYLHSGQNLGKVVITY